MPGIVRGVENGYIFPSVKVVLPVVFLRRDDVWKPDPLGCKAIGARVKQ